MSADSLKIVAVSDKMQAIVASCQIFLNDFSGNSIFNDQFKVVIPENNSTVIYTTHIPFKKLGYSNNHYLLLKWNYNDQTFQKTYLLDKPKNLKLKDPKINMLELEKTTDGFNISLSAASFARAVYLHSSDAVQFYPNYFDMNAGEKVIVHCVSQSSGFKKENIIIQSLFDFIK
jgi:hypothetical protein